MTVRVTEFVNVVMGVAQEPALRTTAVANSAQITLGAQTTLVRLLADASSLFSVGDESPHQPLAAGVPEFRAVRGGSVLKVAAGP